MAYCFPRRNWGLRAMSNQSLFQILAKYASQLADVVAKHS